MIDVRRLDPSDRDWKTRTLTKAWGGTIVARLGEAVDASLLDGFVALEDGIRCGLVTFAVREGELEVVTIQVEREGQGIGQALMEAIRQTVIQRGLRRIWSTTTNNNVRAIDFYQRWGMDMVRLHRHGVAASRAVHPAIPLHDDSGLPIRHELEFELILW